MIRPARERYSQCCGSRSRPAGAPRTEGLVPYAQAGVQNVASSTSLRESGTAAPPKMDPADYSRSPLVLLGVLQEAPTRWSGSAHRPWDLRLRSVGERLQAAGNWERHDRSAQQPGGCTGGPTRWWEQGTTAEPVVEWNPIWRVRPDPERVQQVESGASRTPWGCPSSDSCSRAPRPACSRSRVVRSRLGSARRLGSGAR